LGTVTAVRQHERELACEAARAAGDIGSAASCRQGSDFYAGVTNIGRTSAGETEDSVRGGFGEAGARASGAGSGE